MTPNGLMSDSFFFAQSSVLFEGGRGIPCKQWFLQAGRYATKRIASGLEKPLFAGYEGEGRHFFTGKVPTLLTSIVDVRLSG